MNFMLRQKFKNKENINYMNIKIIKLMFYSNFLNLPNFQKIIDSILKFIVKLFLNINKVIGEK